MALMCERGHRPPKDNLTPLCVVRLGKGAECGSYFAEEPEVERCAYCHRGIFAGNDLVACSFCGAEKPQESPEVEDGR